MKMNRPAVQLICSYAFCAAHRLHRADWPEERNLKVFGKCANTHGHHYKMELHLEGVLNSDTGMLVNGFDVDQIVKPFVEEYLDHKYLNQDVPFFKDYQPTAEWLAVWIYHGLKNEFPAHVTLCKVKIYETDKLSVEYREEK